MRPIERRIFIEAPPEDVWAIAGDVGGADAWISSIVESWVEGDLRYAKLDRDRGTVAERILFHSDAERRLEYELADAGASMAAFRASFAVAPEERGSIVVWSAELTAAADADEAEIAGGIEGTYRDSLENLRALVHQRRDRRAEA